MAFRLQEAQEDGFQRAYRYLAGARTNFTSEERKTARAFLEQMVEELGPVVDAYPTWHPLMAHTKPKWKDAYHPMMDCGYKNIDHTIMFAHGFVTCPYTEHKAQELIESVEALPATEVAEISAELLNVKLYSDLAYPVLVRCNWFNEINFDKTVPSRIATSLMIKHEMENWRDAELGETWETMSDYFLGRPHGKLSSFHISRETGVLMRKVWNALNAAGVFGYQIKGM